MAAVRAGVATCIRQALGTANVVVMGLALTSPAFAWTGDWGFGYSAVYSDNIARVPANEQQEWIHIVSALGAIRESSEDLTARIFSRAELRNYARDVYDDEALLGLDGIATWTLLPRRLTFTVEDRFTQAPIITALAITPENRQDTNIFSLGPDVTYPISVATRAELGGRYSNVYYEAEPNDSERITAYGRLARAVSPITSLSANYEPSWIDYRGERLNPDYFRQDVFIGADFRRPTTSLSLDVGRTYISRENTDLPDIDGRLVRAGITRHLNSGSTLSLFAHDEYSEAGRDQLIINPLLQITPSPTAINTTDFVGGGLYAVQQVDAAYVLQRIYGMTRANLFWRDLDFESPQLMLDQRVRGAFADVGFDFSAAMTAAVFGDFADISYRDVYREDRDYGIGARAVYRFQRTLSFTMEGRWSERESNVAWVPYSERRLVFTVAYDTNYALNRSNPFMELNNPLYR